MKLYLALVFPFCIAMSGSSQLVNKSTINPVATQPTADPSCDPAASNKHGLSVTELVKAIIDQTVCRGSFVTPDGVRGRTFVPISESDRATVLGLGEQAVRSLTSIADDGDSFSQLIAVRLIADIGGADAAPPLERALKPTVWMPTRMAALYGISRQNLTIAEPILHRMAMDADPKIKATAASLLQEIHH
jgi:hypothetical protein